MGFFIILVGLFDFFTTFSFFLGLLLVLVTLLFGLEALLSGLEVIL